MIFYALSCRRYLKRYTVGSIMDTWIVIGSFLSYQAICKLTAVASEFKEVKKSIDIGACAKKIQKLRHKLNSDRQYFRRMQTYRYWSNCLTPVKEGGLIAGYWDYPLVWSFWRHQLFVPPLVTEDEFSFWIRDDMEWWNTIGKYVQ